jgi:hypothetical protein
VGRVFEIGNERVKQGEKRNLSLKISSRPDSSPISIPVIVMNGVRDGPVLCVDCGVHGDEYEPREAIIRVARKLDPDKLAGIVIAVPTINVPAFEVGRRVGEFDGGGVGGGCGLDLNRVWPGNAGGFLTERIAWTFFTEIVSKADYLIDMHCWATIMYGAPLVGAVNIGDKGEESMRLAKSLGVQHIYTSVPYANSLSAQAAKSGVVSVNAEIGGGGMFREDDARIAERGIMNAMKHLHMIEGRPEGLPAEWILLEMGPEGEMMFSNCGGFFLPEVSLSAEVRRGEVMGRIFDLLGDVVEEVRAPHDGLVASYRTYPQVNPCGWVFDFPVVKGRVKNEERPSAPTSR